MEIKTLFAIPYFNKKKITQNINPFFFTPTHYLNDLFSLFDSKKITSNRSEKERIIFNYMSEELFSRFRESN